MLIFQIKVEFSLEKSITVCQLKVIFAPKICDNEEAKSSYFPFHIAD